MTNSIKNQRKTLTIEVEYTLSENDISTENQWTFEEVSPQQAKDIVLRDHIPLDATVWRIGAWFGYPEDRPDCGHEAGIFEQERTDE